MLYVQTKAAKAHHAFESIDQARASSVSEMRDLGTKTFGDVPQIVWTSQHVLLTWT